MISGFDSMGAPIWSSQGDLVPHKFVQVVSRGNSSCAIDNEKTAWCWGANDHGQLGDGTTTNRTAPVKVQGTTKFTSLSSATGNTFCGLAVDGRAWCWGDNTAGQLGSGNTTGSLTPAAPGDRVYTALVSGPTTTCGIAADKSTWCWGANPGNGTSDATSEPTQVIGGHEFTSLTLSASTACGLVGQGKAYCWSATDTGRTGVDPAPAKGTPTEVAGDRLYTHIQAASNDLADQPSLVCAIDTASKGWCWGRNSSGQLGNGTGEESTVPTAVTGNHDFKSLTVASSTVCGIDTSNKAWCWGKNSVGQLGNGSTTDTKDPAAVDPGSNFSAIAASTGSDQSFCALLTDGAVKCWGDNTYGQSHPGSIGPATTPDTIGDFQDLKVLTMGAGFSCVTDKRNEASCWGQNDAGQTGTGNTEENRFPSPAARKDFMPRPFTGYLKGGAQ